MYKKVNITEKTLKEIESNFKMFREEEIIYQKIMEEIRKEREEKLLNE